jgi:hypothetical protein
MERFGVIVEQDMTLHFMEMVNHEGIVKDLGHSVMLERLGWVENTDPVVRWFVRVEVYDYETDFYRNPKKFHWDEADALPPWIGIWEDEIKDRVAKLTARVKTIRDKWYEESKNDGGFGGKNRKKLIDQLSGIHGYVPPLE